MFFFGKKDSDYYFQQGEKLSRSDGKRAIAMFDKAIELSPNDVRLYFRAGSLLFRTSCSREELLKTALQYLTKVAQLDAENSMAHLVRGNVLMHLERPDEAIGAFNESIRTDPQNAAAYNARGRALSQRQQYLTAMDDLSKAVLLAENSMHSVSFKADLDKLVRTIGPSARSAQSQRSDRRAGRSKGACPRCHKSFETADVEIPEKSVLDGVFQGKPVAEVMECRRQCGAMYCWPTCCKMEPCKCGSQLGFLRALVFVSAQ